MKEFELHKDEHIVLETRKHWIIFAGEFLPFAIFLVLPFTLPPLITAFPDVAPFLSFVDYSTPLGRVALGTWLLIFWTSAWGAFTGYFLDVWVLTNERLVSADQRKFFSREVSSLPLSRVQDVTTDVTGVLASLVGFGTIKVQSAGVEAEFKMRGIPSPERMRDLILTYVKKQSETKTS